MWPCGRQGGEVGAEGQTDHRRHGVFSSAVCSLGIQRRVPVNTTECIIPPKYLFLKRSFAGAPGWLRPSVECLTSPFRSGHHLEVRGLEPRVRLCGDGVQPAWDPLSPSLSAPLPCSLSRSQKKIKIKIKINKGVLLKCFLISKYSHVEIGAPLSRAIPP